MLLPYGPLVQQQDANRGRGPVTLRPGEKLPGFLDVPSRNGGEGPGVLCSVVLGIARCEDRDDRREWRWDEEDEDEGMPPALFWPRVRCHLTFGLGGVTFKAKCDFIHGTILSVPMENLKLDAEYDLFKAPDCPECPPIFEVSAGACYYSTGHISNPARLTELVQVAGVVNSSFIEKERVGIPKFALGFSVQPITIGGILPPDINVDIVRFGHLRTSVVIKSPLTNAGQINVENSFPISNDVSHLEISSSVPGTAVSAFIVFNLAL